MQPLEAGAKLSDGTECRPTQVELMVSEAAINDMLDHVQLARTALMSSPSLKAGSGTDVPTSTTAETGKNFAARLLETLCAEYNAVQVEGRNREFPVMQLVGAEEVLARMVHEKAL